MLTQRLIDTIREVPDFPKSGINFKDITPVLEDHELSRDVLIEFKNRFKNMQLDAIIGVESRGFLFGMALSQALEIPFITVRKKGKLPYKVVSFAYDLEYGQAEMEMHVDAIKPGWKVMIHDDLLATGGTAAAAAELVTLQGGQIAGFAFLIELEFLNGKNRLQNYTSNITSLVTY